MRRGNSAELVLIYAAMFGLSLLSGSAAEQSTPLRGLAKDEETAAPVLNPATYHHVEFLEARFSQSF